MHKSLTTTILLVGLIMTSVAIAGDIPKRYNPSQQDHGLSTVQVGDQTWSAWAYRTQGQFDIALSTTDGSGVWSEIEWMGAVDGLDQINPSLVADSAGHLYLTYEVQQTGSVFLSIRTTGFDAWSAPIQINPELQRAHSSSLSIVGGHLVVAYLADDQIQLVDLGLTLAATLEGVRTNTIQDGADPLGLTPEGGSDVGDDFKQRPPSDDDDDSVVRPPRHGDEDGKFYRRNRGSN